MLILARLLSNARHSRVHPFGICLQMHGALLIGCILHVHVMLYRDLVVDDELRCLSSM